MNKYKVTFTESRDYVVDVWAKDEAHAREEADRCFQNDAYHEIGNPEVVIDQVYDVTHTEDPFNPENENDALDEKVLSMVKFYYVSYEVNEDYPSYNFVIDAFNWLQAKELAEKEISDCYPEEWMDNKNYYMAETTAYDLLKRLKIN